MKFILHKDDNGNNLLTNIVEGQNFHKIQEEIGGVDITEQILNIDMEYLNAYDIVNNQTKLNLDKARDIKIQQLRLVRDEAFTAFDKKYDIAFKDELDMTELKQERQRLKDAPQKAEIYLDSCISLNEIKNLELSALI